MGFGTPVVLTTVEANQETLLANQVTMLANQTKLKERPSYTKDFWSDVEDEVILTDGALDTSLGTISVEGLPSNIVITRVVLILKVRAIEDTSGIDNAIASGQTIQVQRSGGAWANAIDMVANMWAVAASTREVGDVVIGDYDIKDTVNEEDRTYNVQWASAQALGADLQLNDILVGFRMFWEVE